MTILESVLFSMFLTLVGCGAERVNRRSSVNESNEQSRDASPVKGPQTDAPIVPSAPQTEDKPEQAKSEPESKINWDGLSLKSSERLQVTAID